MEVTVEVIVEVTVEVIVEVTVEVIVVVADVVCEVVGVVISQSAKVPSRYESKALFSVAMVVSQLLPSSCSTFSIEHEMLAVAVPRLCSATMAIMVSRACSHCALVEVCSGRKVAPFGRSSQHVMLPSVSVQAPIIVLSCEACGAQLVVVLMAT